MDFLQNSHRDAPTTKPNHITSKSREKDKRKAARVQDEISDFFKPSRAPLRETDPNIRGRAPSTNTVRQDSIHSKQLPADGHQRTNGRSQNMDLAKQLERRISLEGSSAYRGRSPNVYYAERPPVSTSKLSGKANTYITWSETQFSPRPTAMSGQQIHFKSQRSPTPASIRRSLRDTGVYHDTGIEIRSESWDSRKERSNVTDLENIQQRDLANNNQKVRQNLPSSRTGGTSSSESVATDPSKQDAEEFPTRRHHRRRIPEQKNSDNTGHHDDFHKYVSGMAFKDRKAETATRGDQRIIIEHFDPELGWHQRPLSRAQEGRSFPEVPRTESERAAKSTSINREQLAKQARIKRPATTLPITRSMEQGNFDKDRFIRVAPQNMNAPPKASEDNQVGPETSAAEQPKLASMIPQTSNGKSTMTASREEERVTADQDFTEQKVDNDYHNVQYPEERLSKEEDVLKHLTNLESESRVQGPREVNRQDTLIRPNNGSYLGLPVRGGWNIRAPTPVYQPARVSPRLPHIKLEPLFIHQVQRRQASEEEHIEHESQTKGGASLDLAASEFASNLPAEDLSHNLSSYSEVDFTRKENFHNDQLYNHNFEPESLTAYAHDTLMWEPEPEYLDGGLEDLKMPIGEDQQPWHHYEPFEGMPAEQLYVPTEDLVGQSYVNYGDEDSHLVQGFWKPQRQY
jgi:hypothetical protein